MKYYIFADLWYRGNRLQIVLERNAFVDFPGSGDLICAIGCFFFTRTNEKSFAVSEWNLLAKWRSGTNFYAVIKDKPSCKALSAYKPETYMSLFFANMARKESRRYLEGMEFIEMQTPVILKNYNGGRSIPTTAHFLGRRNGFLRITMEERLKAAIGAGFDKVFQLGSVFRGSREITYLEAFMTNCTWSECELMLREMLANIGSLLCSKSPRTSKCGLKIGENDWEVIDFVDGAIELLGIKAISLIHSQEAASILLDKGLLSKAAASQRRLADDIALIIAKKIARPCIIRGFPAFTSPLYCKWKSAGCFDLIQRSKGYIIDTPIFDLGAEETNSDMIACNMRKQVDEWMINEEHAEMRPSDLLDLAEGGLPAMAGFAVNIDKLVRLYYHEAYFDPMG